MLHHVSNILNDQVLSFVQHELAEVSEEGFTDILSKDSKVIICENPVHWHFDVDLFRLSELIFSVRTQESLHSWTTAVNNAEIIFENVNILTRDIQVRFHAFLFSFRIVELHLTLNYFLHQEYLHILFDTPGEWERISNCLNEIQVCGLSNYFSFLIGHLFCFRR